MKMWLVPAEGCDKATEEMWCCLMVRVPGEEELASILPPRTEIPDVGYDFFFPFRGPFLPRIFVFLRDRREPPACSHVLLLALLTNFYSCIDCHAIPSDGHFVCPSFRNRRLNPSSSRPTASRGVSFRRASHLFYGKNSRKVRHKSSNSPSMDQVIIFFWSQSWSPTLTSQADHSESSHSAELQPTWVLLARYSSN